MYPIIPVFEIFHEKKMSSRLICVDVCSLHPDVSLSVRSEGVCWVKTVAKSGTSRRSTDTRWDYSRPHKRMSLSPLYY